VLLISGLANILSGNQAELMQSEAGMANRQWRESFGDVYRFKSCFGVRIVSEMHGQRN
jgi:hypothetical protein